MLTEGRRIHNAGFTLLELLVVITITGIIAASLTMFLVPAIQGYTDTQRRAELTDIADTALRRIGQELRRAVPNSIRVINPGCMQFVPTISGGRYRTAHDTLNDGPTLPCAPGAGCSAPLDTTVATTIFDVLTPMRVVPAIGDWVVIDNQNTADVYAGTNRSAITAIAVPAATQGQRRISVNPIQFPAGYEGGRFLVVPNNEQTLFYSCVGNVLFRTVANFNADQAASCAAITGAVAATDVLACNFVYGVAQLTAQNSFLSMRLQLGRDGETITLSHGVHVSNVP